MNNEAKQGIYWKSLESVGVQGVQFIIQLVLARILLPADFGVVAILNVFVNLANTLVQNGLGSAILQKKNPQIEDFATVFYIEIWVSLFGYFLIFMCANAIANYYENPDLVLYLRIFSLTIIIRALGSMQNTVLRYRLNFKPSFIANFVGILFQGFSGISMALLGFGVWSLIVSQIVYCTVTTFSLFIFARWIPRAKFSKNSFFKLFSFSWKLTVGWIIGTIYQDVFAFVIGKVYDDSTLGYYSKGNTIPNVINRIVTQVTTGVMFPVISKAQDDIESIRKQTREMLAVSAAVIFPVMAFVAGAANPIVRLLLTDKWLPAVSIIQIFCIPSSFDVISNANMQSFNAIGHSDVFLISEVIKKGITFALVIILAQIDFFLMLISIAMMSLVSLVINSFFNVKLLNYTIEHYLADLLPSIGFSLVVFCCTFVLNYLIPQLILRLLSQAILSVLLYFIVAQTELIKPCSQVWIAVRELMMRRRV